MTVDINGIQHTLTYGDMTAALRQAISIHLKDGTSGPIPTCDLSDDATVTTLRSDIENAWNAAGPLSAPAAAVAAGETDGDENAADFAAVEIPEHPDLIGIDPAIYRQINALLRAGKQHIMLYGPPGTGKTELARWIASSLPGGQWTLVPVYALLGGAARQQARYVSYEYAVDPLGETSPDDVPALMAENAARSVSEHGTSFVEFKVGVYSLDCDIATFHAVREKLGRDIEIGVDANMAWDIETARRFVREVKSARLDNLEEPVAELQGMNSLSREFAVPVSTHCFWLDAIRAHPDIGGIAVEPHALGGILPMREFVSQVHALGRRVWFRSVWELGVSWAGMCHMKCAFSHLSRPSQSLFNWVGDDLLTDDTWVVRNGGVIVPDTPGLGVQPDPLKLAQYRIDQ